MGAVTFEQYVDGTDIDDAFREGRSAAADEHGHGGYSGTLAEKDDYVVITRTLMTLDDAVDLADTLLVRADPRIGDKWGPAGAIPVRQPTRTIVIDGLSGTIAAGYFLDRDALSVAVRVAEERGLIPAGAAVTQGRLQSYRRAPDPTQYRHTWSRPAPVAYTDGVAELTVQKTPAELAGQTLPDGWLFFGFASH